MSGILQSADNLVIEEHLAVADGDLVTPVLLKPETRRVYKEIAAAIVDGCR